MPVAPTDEETSKKRLPFYSASEVSEHNVSADCWVSFFGNVYNLTPLIEEHKGIASPTNPHPLPPPALVLLHTLMKGSTSIMTIIWVKCLRSMSISIQVHTAIGGRRQHLPIIHYINYSQSLLHTFYTLKTTT